MKIETTLARGLAALAAFAVLIHGASSVTAIDDRAHVVGWSWTSAGAVHAFVVGPDGQRRDLNELIAPDSGWTLQHAAAVDERGQIAGWGRLGGETHGFLLTSGAL